MNKISVNYKIVFICLFMILMIGMFHFKDERVGWQKEINEIRQDYGVQIVFDEIEFPKYWRSWSPRWDAVPVEKREDALLRLKVDLLNYDSKFLRKNLRKVYLISELTFGGQLYGGTNDHVNKWLYLQEDWLGDDGQHEMAMGFHHEFSSILYKNYRNNFDEEAWKKINSSDFMYEFERSSGENLKTDKIELIGNESLYDQGFICSYGTLTLEDDINTYAQLLLAKPSILKSRADRHQAIQEKVDILIMFFKNIGHDRIVTNYEDV